MLDLSGVAGGGTLGKSIGRQLGEVAYSRDREYEFSASGLPVSELIVRTEFVRKLVPRVVSSLSEEGLDRIFPEHILGRPVTTPQFLIHLHGHLTYHLGQTHYLRRFLTSR